MTDEIQALVREAEQAYAQKDWDSAIERYQGVMEADPRNEESCSKLAELFAIRGLISNVVDTYFTLMDILEDKEEHELAVEIARWIMKLQPDNDKARMKTILIYKKKGDMDEVVRQSLQLARLYIELGQGDQSILLLKNAQEIAPDNLDIGLELAEMYISHGHIPEGTSQYKKIANAYLEKGNYEKAAESFRRMKVVQPDDPQLLFTLGNLYMQLERHDEAESEFRAILRHNLNHTDALMALGNVCQKKGQFRDAILAFNKILSVNPQDEIAKEKLGELYQAQGATSEAVKFYLQAANTYQYGDMVDRAIKLYQRVLTIDPTNPTACRELTNLGAPLVPEEGDEQSLKDAYAPKLSPMEVGDDEVEIGEEGPSLEEMAGAILPPSAITMPERADAPAKPRRQATKKAAAKVEEAAEESVPAGAIPSAFSGDDEERIDVEFRRDVGSDLEFASGRSDETDLVYREDIEEEEEDEDESASPQISRKARKKSKGLKKKKGFDKDKNKGLLRKGLVKKAKEKDKEKDKKLLKPGLLSGKGREAVKPSLGEKKGLVSRKQTAKGLFARRGKDEDDVNYRELEEQRMGEEAASAEEAAMMEEQAETELPSFDEEPLQEPMIEEPMEEFASPEEPISVMEEAISPEPLDEIPGDMESEFPEPELLDLSQADMPPVEEESIPPEMPEVPMEESLPDAAEMPVEEVEEEKSKGRKKKGSLLGKKKKKSLKKTLKKEESETVEEIPEVAEIPEMEPIAEMMESIEEPENLYSPEEMTIDEIEEIEEIPEPIGLDDEYPMVEEEDIAAPLDMDMDMDMESDDMAAPLLGEEEEEMALPPLGEEADFPVEDFPDDIELPELDLSESEMVDEPSPLMEEKIPDLQDLTGVMEPMETPPPFAEEMPSVESETPVDLGSLKFDEGSGDDDFFSLDTLPSFGGDSGGMGDLGDFATSLLKLADEIENIIPDEERIRQAEEEKRIEEEKLKEQMELEAEGAPLPMAQGTSFLQPGMVMEEEDGISLEALPPMPVDMTFEAEAPDEEKRHTGFGETVLLPPLEEIREVEVPTAIVEEFEAPAEMEMMAEEVAVEVIEEPPPPEPEVDIEEKVKELVAAGNYGDAFPLYKEAISRHFDDLELRREYADLCYQYGKIDEAINSYKVILKKETRDYEIRRKVIKGQLLYNYNDEAVVSLLEYGNELTGEDKVEEAQRIFQYVLALQKENSMAREALSEIYLNMDMKELALYHLNILAGYLEEQQSVDDAIKILKKIIVLTSNIQTQERLAKVYIENNYKDEAVGELITLAERYIEQEDFNKAAEHYEKVVELNPDHLEGHNRLVFLFEKLGDSGKSYKEKVKVAELYFEKEELDEARKRFEECLSIRNYDHRVRRKLVDIYLTTSNLKRALEESRILSEVYHKERRYNEAIELYQKLIEANPGDLSLMEKLSEFYVMSDQLDKGLEQLIFVAEELARQKNWDGAIKAYKKALTIDNKNANLHFRIGEIFLNEKKNPTEARYEFSKVYELDHTHRRALEYLVKLYMEEDKPDKSIFSLQRLIELDKSYRDMQKEIIEDFEQKIKDNPKDIKAHYNLGVIYKELKMWTKAIEQFQFTRKSDKYNLDSHVMLGICFSQQPPMVNLAVKTLEKGLQLKGYENKDYLELHYQLGRLYDKLKKHNKALVELQAIVAIDVHYKDASELLKEVKAKIDKAK